MVDADPVVDEVVHGDGASPSNYSPYLSFAAGVTKKRQGLEEEERDREEQVQQLTSGRRSWSRNPR